VTTAITANTAMTVGTARVARNSGLTPTALKVRKPAPATPTPRIIPLHRPSWARLVLALATAWADWRATAVRRRDERLIAALPRHVLCDVGLAHLAAESPRPPWSDLERARW
jgi:hypothetical protein